MALQCGQARRLDRPDDLIGDQDVADAGRRHHLGSCPTWRK
jgi:hypothetical protein